MREKIEAALDALAELAAAAKREMAAAERCGNETGADYHRGRRAGLEAAAALLRLRTAKN